MRMPRQPRATNPETRNRSWHFLFPLPWGGPKSAADLYRKGEAEMARGPASNGPSKRDSREPAPSEDRQSRVGEVLRKAYDDALAEPVPDIFADLLRKLG